MLKKEANRFLFLYISKSLFLRLGLFSGSSSGSLNTSLMSFLRSNAGIVHLEAEQLSLCFEKMGEVLKSGGYLFLVYGFGKDSVHSVTYNGEVYARNFISHTREEILSAMNGKFEFVEELEPIRYFKHR